jgi:quinol monooxygenase YgiN
MIHVLASITVKEGRVDEFLEVFKANIPNVLAEKGCIEYGPTVDVQTDLEIQVTDPRVVTIVEKWETLDDLKAHLVAPHILNYRERVKDIVENLSLKIVEPA